MATAVQMPALSPTMKEGKITRWLKKEGDKVSSGEAIAECETDKSNLEIESYEDGYLVKIAVKEGEMAPVGSPIAFIGVQGEKVDLGQVAKAAAPPAPAVPSEPPQPPAKQAAPVSSQAPAAAKSPVASSSPSVASARPAPAQVVQLRREVAAKSGRLRASPLARKMAHDQGLDLAAVVGSGPQGRIVKRDVEAALSAPSVGRAVSFAPRAAVRGAAEVIPLTSMRRVIAQRMTEVKPGVPHFYLTVELEMDGALRIREEAKALDTKVSVNDIIIKATAMALRRFPRMNVSFQGDHILQLPTVDVGVAVAIEDGLITPIVRDADQKGLAEISSEVRDFAERARKRALKPEEYTGGSITVSNLGMFGIDEFVAVINPPQAAILAVGAVKEKAVARNGQVVVRQMMSVTLSGDHRAIDGAVGAQYLQELRGLLEHPMRLLF